MVHTHTHKPVREHEDVTMLWNQGVHTDREVTANRPDIIMKKQKRENMHTDRCVNTSEQKCHAKGSRKEIKCKSLCIEIQRMWNMNVLLYQ